MLLRFYIEQELQAREEGKKAHGQRMWIRGFVWGVFFALLSTGAAISFSKMFY